MEDFIVPRKIMYDKNLDLKEIQIYERLFQDKIHACPSIYRSLQVLYKLAEIEPEEGEKALRNLEAQDYLIVKIVEDGFEITLLK